MSGLPSSLPGGRLSAKQGVVCVDVPDPDNFLMVLRVLRDHPGVPIHIVLSPRPVSFAAIPYGDARFKALIGDYKSNIIGRITQKEIDGWVKEEVHNDDDKKWFYIDEDFTDSEVWKDTSLYRRISEIRLIKFLGQHGIDPTAYSIYHDLVSFRECPIVPGMHHASHTPDYCFDFRDMLLQEEESWKDAAKRALPDTTKLARFNKLCEAAKKGTTEDEKKSDFEARLSINLFLKAVDGDPDCRDGSMRSNQRREDTRLLCDVYLHEKTRTPPYNKGLRDIEELTTKVGEEYTLNGGATEYKPVLYVGGPFIEALKIMEKLGLDKVGPVYAMGGATKGDDNLFANQFNILVEPISARKVLDLATDEKIDLTLLPTECAKGTKYSFNKWGEFQEQVEKHEKTYVHLRDLYSQWGPNRPVNMFDLLAAMAVTTDLYEGMLRSVKYRVDGEGKFHFDQLETEPTSAPSGPGLKMFWTIEDFDTITAEKRDTFLEELRWTVEGKPLAQDSSAKSDEAQALDGSKA